MNNSTNGLLVTLTPRSLQISKNTYRQGPTQTIRRQKGPFLQIARKSTTNTYPKVPKFTTKQSPCPPNWNQRCVGTSKIKQRIGRPQAHRSRKFPHYFPPQCTKRRRRATKKSQKTPFTTATCKSRRKLSGHVPNSTQLRTNDIQSPPLARRKSSKHVSNTA